MKLYIDCDTGIDDAFALGYLLTRPDLDIVGIGSVAGNVSLEKVNRNLRLITSALRPQVNIFKGSPYPILEKGGLNAEGFHGTDGLGEFWTSDYYKKNATEIEKTMEKCEFSEKSAVEGLLELSRQYPGDLVILTLGPLTNIALAQLVDPDFGSRIKNIAIMGGNFGPGNSPHYIGAEYNFSIDPESVHITFNKMPCTKLLYPLGVSGAPTLRQICFDRWKGNQIFGYVLQNCLDYLSPKDCHIYDLIAAVTLVHPEVIKTCLDTYVAIELDSKLSRGGVVIDKHSQISRNHESCCKIAGQFSRISLIVEVDNSKIVEIFQKF